MKPSILMLFALLIVTTHVMAQPNFTLPSQWTKDLRVEVTDKGGMLHQELNIRFTFDSCVYVQRLGSTFKNNSFVLTNNQRIDILEKLKELKQDPIGMTEVAYDKSTSSIGLFTHEGFLSVSDDSESEELKQNFSEVYNYLVSLAMPKEKKKEK